MNFFILVRNGMWNTTFPILKEFSDKIDDDLKTTLEDLK